MTLNFEEEIVLESERVRLEPLLLEHSEKLLPIVLNNPGILKYSPPKFGTEELLVQYIEKSIALRSKQQKYSWAVFDKEVGEYAGSTSYLNIYLGDQRLEIGSTWIGKKFQRTGLNRNCKFLLMGYAFEKLGALRLEFKTDGRNEQSKEAIQKIGGKYEGTLRSHTVMSDGYRRDTVYYSVLASEWESVKADVFVGI